MYSQGTKETDIYIHLPLPPDKKRIVILSTGPPKKYVHRNIF
jgi:hypothetical protein